MNAQTTEKTKTQKVFVLFPDTHEYMAPMAVYSNAVLQTTEML